MAAGGLVVYVTSHGFGHLNRSAAVINRMPWDVPVTVRCHPDLFAHWRERLRRPADLGAHVSDVGAVNPPGDSASTDGPATLARASAAHADGLTGVAAEARWLRDAGASAVLCDAPPLPLVAAREAGVPGFLLANFTWAQIYAPHARTLGGAAPGFVAEVRAAYRQAAAVFRAQPALRMADDFPPGRVIDVGLVVTPGRDRRVELREQLGLGPEIKLVYMYTGRYGQDGMGWGRLAELGRRGVHFVGFHAPPAGADAVPNVHVVPPTGWDGADLAASADAVAAKAGYGTVCEAMVARTPILYPPRAGFAEYRALDRALRDWGGGLPVPASDFAAFRIGRQLDRAFALRPGPPPFPADGAARVADRLTRVCRGEPS